MRVITHRLKKYKDVKEKLEKQIELVEKLDKFSQYSHLSRDISNNRFLASGFSAAPFFAGETSARDHWDYPALIDIFKHLGKRGDSLSMKIHNTLYNELDEEISWRESVYLVGSILEKLLRRQMDEFEYNNYLSGKKPIFEHNSKKYFIAKKN